MPPFILLRLILVRNHPTCSRISQTLGSGVFIFVFVYYIHALTFQFAVLFGSLMRLTHWSHKHDCNSIKQNEPLNGSGLWAFPGRVISVWIDLSRAFSMWKNSHCSSWLFCCSGKTLTRSSLGLKRTHLAYTSRSQSITEGIYRNPGRNWSRNTEEFCLASCCLSHVQLSWFIA